LSGVIEERLGVEYIFGDLVNSYSLAECECHDVYSVVPSNDSFTSNMIPSMAWIISVMNVAGGPLLNGALGRVYYLFNLLVVTCFLSTTRSSNAFSKSLMITSTFAVLSYHA